MSLTAGLKEPQLSGLASRLVEAYHSGLVVGDISPESLPATLADAEALQDEIFPQLGPIAAWKVGASPLAVRTRMGLPRIFFGALPESVVFDSPANIPRQASRLTGVETEFCFRFGEDLRPREKPYSETEVRAAVSAILPSLEIPGTRFSELGIHGTFALIGDIGASGLLVVGAGHAGFDAGELFGTEVCLRIDGELVASGTGAEIIGGPFGALVEQVNLATSRGYTLKAGQVVATGSCTGYVPVPRGVTAEAEFGRFGSVTLKFLD